MPEQDRARIHCFNCMFYTRLTAEGVNKFEAGHALVSRWTKNVDIFSKDFILIPINYSYHWSLAVIVRPGALLVKTIVTYPLLGLILLFYFFVDFIFCVQADLESLQANLEELMNAPPNSQETNPSSAAKRGRSKKIAADSSEAAASAVVGVEVTNAGGVLDLTSTPRSSASTPTTTAGGVTKGDSGSSMADVMASASARISRHASSQLLDQQGANSSNKKNNSHKGSASRGDGAESDATFEDSNFAGAGGKMDVVTSSPPALVLSSGDHTADNSGTLFTSSSFCLFF